MTKKTLENNFLFLPVCSSCCGHFLCVFGLFPASTLVSPRPAPGLDGSVSRVKKVQSGVNSPAACLCRSWQTRLPISHCTFQLVGEMKLLLWLTVDSCPWYCKNGAQTSFPHRLQYKNAKMPLKRLTGRPPT